MMLIRAFIAVELPPHIQKELEIILINLQKSGVRSVKWVNPHAIHLTLKFLGESSPQELSQIADEIRKIAATTAPLEVQVQGIGAFPNLKRPRVVWVGLKSPPGLFRLQKALEDAAEQIGYPREEREFSPHLTLGRVKREASPTELTLLGQTIAQKSVGTLGTMMINQLVLFRSDLKPEGAIYTPLAHFSLNG